MLQSPASKAVFKIEIFDFKVSALTSDPHLSSFEKYILIYCEKVLFVVLFLNPEA